MTWFETLPVLLAVVAILLLPGLGIGWTLGARGLTLFALAPVLTISTVAVGSLSNYIFDFEWGLLPLILTTVILGVVVSGLRLLWRARWPRRPRVAPRRATSASIIGGLGFAFIAISGRLAAMFGEPDHISQTFDNVYHLNAVQWIVNTGIASPFNFSSLTFERNGEGVFYPNTWHAFAAVVAETTGASIPITVNLVNIAIASVAWPLACVFLVRLVVGSRPFALLSAGVLSAAFAAFPYLMVDFGVLYPNLLSISLLPVALGLVALVAGLGEEGTLTAPARWVVLAGVVPGIALAHPSTLMALIAFSAPIGLLALFWHFRLLASRGVGVAAYAISIGTALVIAGVAAKILMIVRPTFDAAFWGPRESVAVAAGAAITNSTVGRPADFILAALLLIGVWAVVRHRNGAWVIGSFVVSAGLYVVAAGFEPSYLRYGLTGIWYNDSYRLAALLPVVALPLAAVGATWCSDRFRGGIVRVFKRFTTVGDSVVSGRRSRAAALLASLLVILTIAISTQTGAALAYETKSAQHSYEFDDDSALLSPDELTLLRRVDSEVPAGASVIGSPWTGTSLVYTFSDRRALLPHIYGDRDPGTVVLLNALRNAKSDPQVCEAIEAVEPLYVLDFGRREVHPGTNKFSGLSDLKTSPAVRLIDKEGSASLFAVTACP